MALSLLALDKKYSKLKDEFVRSLGVLSPARVKKYHDKLGKIFRLIGDPESITKNELMDFISKINTGDLADSTKRDYRLITKKFFGWLDNPEFVSWIKVGTVRTRIGPEDILTESELSKIKAYCKSLRDKAPIETLYETATRPHEFLGLRKTDVAFDDLGAIVFISKGKTGARRVRVFNAVVPLAAWIKNHRVKSRDAFLWVAILPEDIERYDLPPLVAKVQDPNFKSFSAKYGTQAVELDALPPEVLAISALLIFSLPRIPASSKVFSSSQTTTN